MATKEAPKNILYFLFKCVYLTNKLSDPHILLLESDKHIKIKLSAKFKKFS